MAKKVIVTEKPSVAREIAKVLGVTNKCDGYFENNEWIISWCYGHLITLAYPEEYNEELKQWSMNTLPFLPERYKYHVIPDSDRGKSATQFYTIKKLYNRPDIDTIYYCPDPAREGITIQAYVRMMAGHTPGVNELVIWIDSQTESEIKRGIREAKPYSEYENLAKSGYMRGIEDYDIGINYSRALSLKYRPYYNGKQPLATGRVMTCVLGMVTQREIEIENFVPQDFYKIQSVINVDNTDIVATWKVTKENPVYLKIADKLYSEQGFKTEADARDFMSGLGQQVEIDSIDIKNSNKGAPLLFNMTELQASCSKLFKITPAETLDIAQKLYEAKMTTYPRTSARVLTNAIADEISYNLNGLKKYDTEIAGFIDQAFASGRVNNINNTPYVDDSKVEDHYAIIPTGENVSNYAKLSDLEQKVYDLIVRRFVSIFMEPAVYKKISLVEKDTLRGEKFYASGSTLISPGYMLCSGIPNSKENLPEAVQNLTKGKIIDTRYEISKGETKPPSRYTSGSIVLAMENAGTLIEDEELRSQMKMMGIGTDATRSECIAKLCRIGYLQLNKKTMVLTPSDFGRFVYNVTAAEVPELLNPTLTAQWEQGLDLIANGSMPYEKYMVRLNGTITNAVNKIKTTPVPESINTMKKIDAPGATQKTYTVSSKDVATYLSVPYDRRDEVKALGARWDGTKKAWYVPAGKDIAVFKDFMSSDGAVKSVKKIYLNVSYDDKDEVKALGARWDGTKKQWFIMSNQDVKKFAKWAV